MTKYLVIVESPAKARTIQKYLGSDFVVAASMGHVRDLPQRELGVDLDDDFKPKYEAIPRSRETIKRLRDLAKKVDAIYLAADPDREGEAIAWHLSVLLKRIQSNIRRIEFHSVTKDAVKNAVANPRDVDMNRVNAQQARRVLDRLVGYQVSPLLWEKVARKLSAGRVQTVALRLICEREEEIESFKQERYFTIDALLQEKHTNTFEATLHSLNGKKLEKLELQNEEAVNELVKDLKNASWEVHSVERQVKQRRPSPVFTTSSLQQEAAKRLNFKAKRTMAIAQQLYEGIDIGSETTGLITYMRTDSVHIVDEAIAEVRDFIQNEYGESHLPTHPNVYSNKQSSAQEAHEGIRPTSVWRTPEMMQDYLDKDQLKLYTLIWKRFVASQMNAAKLGTIRVDIKANNAVFRATGSTVINPGFMSVYDYIDSKDKILPEMSKGEKLRLKELSATERWTKPPERYTEAKLIKELEEKGIGRPSTYSSIISTLVDRQPYVEMERKFFVPTKIGRTVCNELIKAFPDIFEVGFTSDMEERLDEISSGQRDWVDVLKEFYGPFEKRLQEARKSMAKADDKDKYQVIKPCPECDGDLVEKKGRYGKFYACTNYPECKYIEDPKRSRKKEPVSTGRYCPECNEELLLREGKNGKFIACSGFPDCKFTEPYIEEGQRTRECPECGEPMIERKSKNGGFWGCTAYPRCNKTLPLDKDIVGDCPECNGGKLVKRRAKKTKKNFYGCSNWPSCDYITNEKP